MAGIWDKVTEVSSPSWTSISEVSSPSWTSISEVTTPSWTSISEITTPSWSTVTVLNSITYKENYGPTPSIDLVNAWNLIDDEWEHFNYDYEDLII